MTEPDAENPDLPPESSSDGPIQTANAFDPSRLRLNQNFATGLAVKKEIVTVPVRKPNRHSFIRVHPDESMRLSTATVEFKDERELYLIASGLWDALREEAVPTQLYVSVDRHGVVFLWHCRLPNEHGRIDSWNNSVPEIAEMAVERWLRVVPNHALGAYEPYVATSDLPDPEWPDLNLEQLLERAFRERFIESIDHPALRRLRGEI